MISGVGGCYAEKCLSPQWDYIFGSAGRAAAALSACTAVELHTLLSRDFERDFLFLMAAHDVVHKFIPEGCSISFEYLHPLALPTLRIEGEYPPSGSLPHVRSENILIFGMVEYMPTVHGRKVVYDPQSGQPIRFSETGSTAQELVYVLNTFELEKLTTIVDLADAANFLLQRERASAVIVKRGPGGATLFGRDGKTVQIPCYRARRVFKIGSGDIFAAAFAFFWQAENEQIETAADLASRAVACYVETKDASLPTKEQLLRDYNEPIHGSPGLIYLAAPFFSLEQRWILEETKALLENLGCVVFSPLHDVGTNLTCDEIASADLAGLERSSAILALANDGDVGTVFEVGYGNALRKPTIIYAEKNAARDLVMLEGSECMVFPDYCSAIYTAVWESLGP
jgi:Nucleoside 2-deoxyribosyltransferase/pfkB family carbohydrate kinase